jgi:orotate phosphoribosyltransferase
VAKEKDRRLADYNNLLELAVAKNYISDKELITLREWRESPSSWRITN